MQRIQTLSGVPATAVFVKPAQSGLKFREARVHSTIILQLVLSIGPAMALVGFGKPMLAARYGVCSLFAFLASHIAARDRFAYFSLAIGAIPVLTLLRGLFVFYSVLLIFAGGLLLWVSTSPREFQKLWDDRVWKLLFFAAALYCWISMIQSGEYGSNLRVFELVFGAAAFYLLSRRRSWLATALVGFGISTIALGLGLSPYGDRLGMGQIEEMRVGNPILVGLPAVLFCLVCLADNGRWLLLHNQKTLRLLLFTGAGLCLVLSGSRGSWIVGCAGILILVLFSANRRKTLLVPLALLSLATFLMISLGSGATAVKYFEKTLSSERTLANRTSGRSEQWRVIPQVFMESPLWGFGPGAGTELTWTYTGRHLGWHSLYLNMIAGTGLIGITLVILLLWSLSSRAIKHLGMSGEIAPLVGIVGFLAIGASVSGTDATSGMFLGLAFLGRDFVKRCRIKRVLAAPGPVFRRNQPQLPISEQCR